MAENNFIQSIEEREIRDNAMKLVKVAGRSLLMVKQNGQVFGLSNLCPHMGCSLSNGTLKEYIITCPCHGWSFDIRSGQYQMAKKKTLMTYECKIQNGKIFVRIK